jgi:hypothetical protein
MLAYTRNAIEAILESDPTLDGRTIHDVMSVVSGEKKPVRDDDDEVISRKEVARILGVVPATVTLYAHRGLIRPVWCGERRERVRGYSRRSVRDFLMGKTRKEPSDGAE